MKKNRRISILIVALITVLNSFAQQKKYEVSPLLNGIGLNTILSHINDYTSGSEKNGEDTLTYYRVKDGQLTFLGNDITETVISKKNDLIEFIAFIIEKKEIETPQFSEKKFNELILKDNITEENASTYRKSKLVDFYIKNSQQTQKVKEYLTTNYKFISEDANCQFNCADKWESDYAKLYIEKNNYFSNDGETPTVSIEQGLIIKSTLAK